MSILDLSKTLMYEFHYNHIKKKYGDRAQLLFTDSDSLCYDIQTKHFYDDSRMPKLTGMLFKNTMQNVDVERLLRTVRRHENVYERRRWRYGIGSESFSKQNVIVIS